MKSGKQKQQEIKQKRLEIKQKRLDRAKKQNDLDCRKIENQPDNAVLSDHNALTHNNTYDTFPLYYFDKHFTCKDCGSSELWTAKQQKWWYEIAKGSINSTAVRCRPCRKIEQNRKIEARKIHLEGLAIKGKTLN